MEHYFNGHEVNGYGEVNGKKLHDRAFHFVNKLHDFNGIYDLIRVLKSVRAKLLVDVEIQTATT